MGLIRAFFNDAQWNEERTFSRAEAWLDLLQIAAYTPSERYIKGKSIHLKIGEFVAAERFLEKRWSWSRTKVRNFIQIHEKNHRLDHRKDQGETVRKVCNYCDWVHLQTAKDTNENTTDQTNGEPTTRPTENQIKELKELKELKEVGADKPPQKNPPSSKSQSKGKAESIDELSTFCKSLDLPKSDAEYLWNKWEANGWTRTVGNKETPMKCWQSTIRSWKAAKYLPSQKQQAFAKPAPPTPPTPQVLPEPIDWKHLVPPHIYERGWGQLCQGDPAMARDVSKGESFVQFNPDNIADSIEGLRAI